jgi:hypothetical protein
MIKQDNIVKTTEAKAATWDRADWPTFVMSPMFTVIVPLMDVSNIPNGVN